MVWQLFEGQRPIYYSKKYKGWLVSLSNHQLMVDMGARSFDLKVPVKKRTNYSNMEDEYMEEVD